MNWQTSRFSIALNRPLVMGIVNATPDSFSDGGRYAQSARALQHCEQLIKDGADILDIGGESTRPGSPESDQLFYVQLDPASARGAGSVGVPVSVHAWRPEVMRAVLDLGADIINDIWALRQPGAQAVVASHPACGVCLMHMHRDPQTMQASPMDGDIVLQVRRFLQESAESLCAMGVQPDRIVLDPGVGFGKTVEQNFSLLAHQAEFLADGYPLLAGWSRKSSLGAVTGMEVDQRMVPSVAAALLAVERGAHIVRVHDVRETVAALSVWKAARPSASLAR